MKILCLVIIMASLASSCTTMAPAGSVRPAQSGVSVKADYPINGANFTVLNGDIRELFAAREMLDLAAEGLDLSDKSTHSAFIERYKAERKKHPELKHLLILSPQITGLP